MKSDKCSSRYYGVFRLVMPSENIKFRTAIKIGKVIRLGNFYDEVDAAKAYDKCVRENNLDRRLNFPDPEPDNPIPNTRLIRLTRSKFAVVDEEDYERVNQYEWCLSGGVRDVYYAARQIVINEKRTAQKMHNFILNINNSIVDHKNHNGLHNYKSNLRECTNQQNCMNTRPAKGKTSKYKGVSWCVKYQRFMAIITADKKTIYLGRSCSEEVAARMYDKAAKEYHKEFAYLNFPDIK